MRDTLGVGTCSFSRFSHSHFPDLSRHGLHYGAKSVARALSFARGGGDIKGGLAFVVMAVRRPCARVGSGDVSLAAARDIPPALLPQRGYLKSSLCPALGCLLDFSSFLLPGVPFSSAGASGSFWACFQGITGHARASRVLFRRLETPWLWVSRGLHGHQASPRKYLPHYTPRLPAVCLYCVSSDAASCARGSVLAH